MYSEEIDEYITLTLIHIAYKSVRFIYATIWKQLTFNWI